jgi:hypothetical protein
MSAKQQPRQLHNASSGAPNDSHGEGLNAGYRVGYGRPPRSTQFKPGQVGNPKGRPRGSANARTVVERALKKQITVRKGKKTCKMSMLEALADTYAIKAVQGDRHAAGVLIGLAIKTGVISAQEDQAIVGSAHCGAPVAQTRPSEALVESIDQTLLPREDLIELARLAEMIDNGGDVTALSTEQFGRLKELLSKGRRKDVSPQADASGGETK